MDADAIRTMLKRYPFVPFEVVLSTGERHPVKYPEFVIVSPSYLVIADPVTDRLAILAPVQVVELRVSEPAIRSV